MPTRREREYYAAGYRDGLEEARRDIGRDFGSYESGMWRSRTGQPHGNIGGTGGSFARGGGRRNQRRKTRRSKPRTLSKWQKYIKNKRNHIKLRNGKLNLKKMAVQYRKKNK